VGAVTDAQSAGLNGFNDWANLKYDFRPPVTSRTALTPSLCHDEPVNGLVDGRHGLRPAQMLAGSAD
jgi:hypothetical protein